MNAHDFNPLPPRFSRFPLWLSLLIFFVLTAALIASVPLQKSPDESAHWQYVQQIALTGQLPVFKGAPPPQPGYEFHQPPLYYLLCAPLWNATGAGVQNYACRAVSLGCGLATIWVIWSAARLLFPLNSRVASVAALFAALFPLHQAVNAGGNNDSLAGLISASLFFLMARFGTRRANWRDVWQLGVVTGLAILTKNTLLVVAASAFVALFFAARRDDSAVRPILAVGAAMAIGLIIGGAWLIRNNTLYGDPFAYGAFTRAAHAGAGGWPEASTLLKMPLFTYARGMIWVTFLTAWGFFGGPDAANAATRSYSSGGPRLAESWLWLPVFACFCAPILAMLGSRRTSRPIFAGVAPSVTRFWALGVALIFLAWVQFAAQFFAAGQARYLHPALLPFCVWGAAGWVGFWGEGRALKIASTVFGVVLIGLTLMNVFVWKTLTD